MTNPIATPVRKEWGLNVREDLYIHWGDKAGQYTVLLPDETYPDYKRDIRQACLALNNFDAAVEALRKIANTKGPFAKEQLRFRNDTVDSIRKIARAVIAEIEKGD